jgi:sugar lactone lactonase YvrE
MDTPFLKVWNIGTETFGDFGAPGETIKQINDVFICTQQGDRLRFYDTKTLEPADDGLADLWSGMLENKEIEASGGRLRVRFISLEDGSKAGVKGQEYFIQRPDDSEPAFRPIPVLAPATRIHTVISDMEGVLWGSSGFGQTIFRYDPRDGSYWNSGAVCNAGGEVYGMAFAGDELFMAAYAGGDHIVYRPSDPWDQFGNVNPRTLRSVGPELIRPHGKTVVGPDGGIWTGWMAKYGVYGGGLSRIDAVTKEVTSWYDPVPGQEIGGLTADGERLYFTTGTGGNGLKARDEPTHFGVWEPEGRISFLHRFDSGDRGGVLLAAASYVWVRVGSDIAVFDPRVLAFVKRIPLGEGCGCIIADGPDRIAVFGQKTLFAIDTERMTAEPLGTLPGNVSTAARTPDGSLYFNCYGTKLYKWNG